MSALPGGATPLGGGVRIAIRKRRILSPASCELRDGGLTIPGCDRHLELVDIATGIMYLVPLSTPQTHELRKRLVG